MKKLLIGLLILISSYANATNIAFLKNRANGYIYFTDTTCDRKNNNFWKILYATQDGGQTIWGCWFYDDGMIHVEWNDGSSYSYPAGALTIIKK